MHWLLRRCTVIVTLASLVPLLQGQQNTAKPLVENEHVRITRVDLARDATYSGKTPYHQVTIQLNDAKTQLLEPAKVPKTRFSKSGDFEYFVAGSRRSLRNIDKQTASFVVIQFLRAPGKYEAMEVTRSHYCNPGSNDKSCVTEQYHFCTERFCAETVSLDPGAISSQHTHDSDHILVATSDFTWREEAVGKQPREQSFKAGDAFYNPAGLTHKFINVGKTPARMFVIQYK